MHLITMKVSEPTLSLFVLLGSSAHLAQAFQVAPQQSFPLSRVESSPYPQSNVVQSRWNAVNKLAGLSMSVEGDAEASDETESESSENVSEEVIEATDNTVSETNTDDCDESASESSEVVTESSDTVVEPAMEPYEVVAESSDTVVEPMTEPSEAVEESLETPAVAVDESEDKSTPAGENVAFFASKSKATKDEVKEEVEEPAPADIEDSSEERTDDSDMSVKEILAVAEEMEQIVESLPDPVVEKKPPISLKESLRMASQRGIEFMNSPPPPPPAPRVKTEDDEKIEAFVQALGAAAKGTTKEIANTILGKLRMAAANALTTSLPEDDRAKLLERIKVQVKAEDETEEEEEDEDEEEAIRASIAEEIAAAKAEQARRSEELWEAEKEALIKQMEEAANARVENELAIQKERLMNEMKAMQESLVQSKQQLEDEKTKLEGQMAEMDKKIEEMRIGSSEVDELQQIIDKREKQKTDLAKVEDDLRAKLEEIENQKQLIAEKGEELLAAKVEIAEAEQAAAVEATTSQVEAPSDPAKAHPVLGQMVCDLGYKRIYLTSAKTLGTLPIWKKQRIYRQSRARSMALDKAKNMDNGFPGAICLAEDSEGGLSVLDGQHRIGMMQMLQEMVNEDGVAISSEMKGYFDKVLVEVYPNLNAEVDDDKHAESVFLEINKAEPVKLVDMPGIASARDNRIITQAVQRLEEQFPQMFSPSQKCRVPNVNVDNLRNNIFGANIMKRHRLRSGKQLFDWLLVQNAAVGASYELDAGRREAISESAWEKASENAFYLGLESSWLYM